MIGELQKALNLPEAQIHKAIYQHFQQTNYPITPNPNPPKNSYAQYHIQFEDHYDRTMIIRRIIAIQKLQENRINIITDIEPNQITLTIKARNNKT